jgi:hypothetical protein
VMPSGKVQSAVHISKEKLAAVAVARCLGERVRR